MSSFCLSLMDTIHESTTGIGTIPNEQRTHNIGIGQGYNLIQQYTQ